VHTCLEGGYFASSSSFPFFPLSKKILSTYLLKVARNYLEDDIVPYFSGLIHGPNNPPFFWVIVPSTPHHLVFSPFFLACVGAFLLFSCLQIDDAFVIFNFA